MRKALAGSLVPFSFLISACGGTMESAPKDVLPLKTLRLYESGVGYFERSGELSSASSMTLPVPSGHLDDALKTLVVLSKNGSVQAVEFPSNVGRAMARALAGLPKDADTPIAYKDLLASMKGASVVVHTRSSEIRGRVIDVVADDAKKADETKGTDDSQTLLLLADSGAIQRVRTTDIVTIKPLDPALTTKLDAALDALSPHGAQDRALEVLAHAQGPITLGYIAETPVYRTTYRLVLDDDAKGKGLLQGWALVHNDTDENWQKVKVELVNGRPDSFLFPLAAPRYERRELATPDVKLSTVPQLLDQTADGIWGDNVDGDGSGGLGLSGVGEGGGGFGYGSGHGRLSGSHAIKAPTVVQSDALSVGNLAENGESTGVESGALFVYSLGEPLDLHAHSSALLPFVRRTIKVDEISWIGSNDADPRAAAKLVNDSTQTLPAGPISFFARGGFSGESTIDRLKPGEQRFVEYGADLDLAATRKNVVAVEQPKKVSYANGELREDYLQTTDWTYEFENRSGRTKNVEARLSIVSNASVTGADKIDFDTESEKPVAVFAIPQGKKIARQMHVIEGLARSTQASQLKSTDIEKLAGELGPAGAQLLDVAHKQKDVEGTNDKIAKTKKLVEGAEKDLERWRENLKAAGGDKSGGAPNTLVQRVIQLEDKLAKLQATVEQLENELTTRSEAVHDALEKLPPS